MIQSADQGWSALPSDLGYGRADGPHRPIEWVRSGALNGSIGPDSGRGATKGLRMGLIFQFKAWTFLV